MLRDVRPWPERVAEAMREPAFIAAVYGSACAGMIFHPLAAVFGDVIFLVGFVYFCWLMSGGKAMLPFKLPKSAGGKDPNNKRPGGGVGPSEGIMYLGNDSETGEEIWFTNNDARTHILYLGTTGSGKTFGLKSIACNALCWGSGFIFIDGKADTDLWSSISALARRFGRDDDLLVMNYMTGNSGGRVASNTLNPFSSGSASYLTNMLVSLMPDAEGDNAMWKDRAVALISALMPCLVWKRDHQNLPLSIGVIRKYLTFKDVIRLSRDQAVPETLRAALHGYLNELPGYDTNLFDDEGNAKQQPDGSIPDVSMPNQQHGYLSMQFTRSMQSLGDDYGFIFDTQAADVDMLDVVLNRRILVVLIPALEKSSDETANLGKIIASSLKGMMGATLGNTVEGEASTAIENKPTRSETPFVAIFDEVGYYTAQGMAVMAAQARSLGFSLVFAGQDLPALEKRVKEEARSITANCNIKLFGKLEDPTSTKDFFEKTVGSMLVAEVSGFARDKETGGKNYSDSNQASIQSRARASYDGLRGFTEGKAICAFGKTVSEINIYNSDIGFAKAMRVHRFLPVPPPSEETLNNLREVDVVIRRLRNRKWNAASVDTPADKDIAALVEGFALGKKADRSLLEMSALSVSAVAAAHGGLDAEAVAVQAESEVDAGDLSASSRAAQQETRTSISWDDIVSGDDQKSDAPLAEADGQESALSWADVLGLPGVDQAEESAPSAKPKADLAAPVTQAEPQSFAADLFATPVKTIQESSDKENQPQEALSWADVIGISSETGEGEK